MNQLIILSLSFFQKKQRIQRVRTNQKVYTAPFFLISPMLLPRTPDKNSILFYPKTGVQKNHSPSSFGYMEEVGKAEIKKQDIFQIESLHSSKRGGTPGQRLAID
jgi:hypothetical protein